MTFNVSFVDTGYDISTRPYSSYSVKFKYSNIGYAGICRCCTCIQVRIHVLMNSVNFGREVKPLTSSGREFQILGLSVLKPFSPKVVVFAQ